MKTRLSHSKKKYLADSNTKSHFSVQTAKDRRKKFHPFAANVTLNLSLYILNI